MWGKQRWNKLRIGFVLIFLVELLPEFRELSQVCMKCNIIQREDFFLFLV